MPDKVASIRARLLDLVDSLPEGAALPGERELATRWDVARMTLRRAMDDLVMDELIVRRQGRGTFTARPKVVRRLATTSFTEDMARRGMRPGSRTLEVRHRRADRTLSRRLRIPLNDPVVAFMRLRLADDAPMAVERCFVAQAYVPGFTAADLDGSWYETLAARYQIRVTSAAFTVQSVLPDTRTADWLEIPMLQPCLQLEITSVDGRGRVIEVGTATYRGDRYSLTAELRPACPAH